MKNQQIKQENPNNNRTTEMPHAEKIYAFNDLPTDVRERLLQMQNTDGDFLRTGEKRVALVNIIGLFFALTFFDGFIKSIDSFKGNVVQLILFGFCSVVFIYWIAYFGRAVYRTFALPIKHYVYLTRTQIIETKDGAVRFLDLKDVVKITLEKFANKTMSGGWDYILIFEFADGFQIGCAFPRWWKEHYAEAEEWLAKSNIWRDDAAEAFRRRNAAFFTAHDFISKAVTANLPVLKVNSRFLFVSPRLMTKITLAMFVIGIVGIVLKLTGFVK